MAYSTHSTPRYYRALKKCWYGIKYGVANLIDWFSIIWKDRDWDQSFMEDILIKKLTNMAKYYKTYGNFIGSEVTVQRIETCIRLLERIRDSYYELEVMSYYEQDFRIAENGQLIWEDVAYDNLGAYYDKYPLVYKRVFKHKHNELDRIGIGLRMSYYNQERARSLAYKIIAQYSPGWWE